MRATPGALKGALIIKFPISFKVGESLHSIDRSLIESSSTRRSSGRSSWWGWALRRWSRARYLILDHWVENNRCTENWRAWLALLLFWLVILALLFRSMVLSEDAWATEDRVEWLIGGNDREIHILDIAEIESAIRHGGQSGVNDTFLGLQKRSRILAVAVHAVILVQAECVVSVGAQTTHVTWYQNLSLRDDTGCRALTGV